MICSFTASIVPIILYLVAIGLTVVRWIGMMFKFKYPLKHKLIDRLTLFGFIMVILIYVPDGILKYIATICVNKNLKGYKILSSFVTLFELGLMILESITLFFASYYIPKYYSRQERIEELTEM